MVYDATMFSPMRWIPPPYALVWSLAVFEAGAATATTAHDADTPVRTGTTGRLENQAGVVVLLVIPVPAGTVPLVVMCAHRLRFLLAASPGP